MPDSKPANNPISEHVLKSGQPLVLEKKRIEKAGVLGVMAGVYIPMTLGNKVIGVIAVENVSTEDAKFSKHDVTLLRAISDYVTIAIANSRNYEALRRARMQINTLAARDSERYTMQPVAPSFKDNRQEVSVLFAEIAGYSTWGESASAEKVVETLNHYLDMASGVILAWEGTLDRYSGDGLMAIFNSPNEQKDHVHRAADAALALMKAAEEVAALYGPQLSYRVGVHVGTAVVGHIGAPDISGFTAIGEVVGLAKRLQSYAAPGQVLVDEAVIKRLGHLAQAHPVGEITVKGRQEKAFVYELTALQYPAIK